jgi:hypothetical protein
MEEIDKERFFSVELKSKVNLKNVTVRESSLKNVLVEGTLGKLQCAEFNDGMILEVFDDITIGDITKREKSDRARRR